MTTEAAFEFLLEQDKQVVAAHAVAIVKATDHFPSVAARPTSTNFSARTDHPVRQCWLCRPFDRGRVHRHHPGDPPSAGRGPPPTSNLVRRSRGLPLHRRCLVVRSIN